MRLIDADALMKSFENVLGAAPCELNGYEISEVLNCQEPIDAIPVEWLEEHDSEGNEYGRRYITVVEALSMWQKEQEAR